MSGLAYDGTFEGFLTVFSRVMEGETPPEAFLPLRDVPPLFSAECPLVTTDHEVADRTRSLLQERLPRKVRRSAYLALLSEGPGIAVWTARYLVTAMEIGAEVDLHVADEAVHNVHAARRQVLTERHRLLGLVRFRWTGNVYYAPIEPDTDVLELLGGHFAVRFNDQRGMIHDLNREKGLLFWDRRWKVTPLEPLAEIPLDDREKRLQALWQRYFRSAAVEGRENPKLQRRHMPRRYWKHLVEDPGENG